jgi:hypothetical protein
MRRFWRGLVRRAGPAKPYASRVHAPQTRTRTAHINVASARQAQRRPYAASSGVEVTREAFQLWDVRNGKAIRCEMFDQEAEALAAVGRRSS